MIIKVKWVNDRKGAKCQIKGSLLSCAFGHAYKFVAVVVVNVLFGKTAH